MVEHEYKDLFYKRNTDKQLKITTDDGLFTATNSDIKWENFELTESLCSDSELQFGSCEASMVKFQILNAFMPIAGKWLTVTETIGGNADTPFQYGKYKVFSDKPTADKEYRDIVAYDAMYEIINADVSDWYNTILPNKDSTKTLKQFRESFILHFGISEQVPKDGLVNDNMTVERTVEPEQISGKDVITAICEINGCFGHIGRDGKFHYIYLPQNIQGLYPADFLYPDHVPEQWDYLSQAETGHLYPQNPKAISMGDKKYKKCEYEDYVVRTINRLEIKNEENEVISSFGEGNNCYVVEGNFLAYGKTKEELDKIAENIYGKITGIVYIPFSADFMGNPCFEVGDPIRIGTKYKSIESYIFFRTLKGIQGLTDSYSAKGLEIRSKNENSITKSISKLEGKAASLDRTDKEIRIEMRDADEMLSSTISITAAEIRTELKNTKDGLESTISQTAGQIRLEVTDIKNNLQSQITQNAGEISLRVRKDSIISEINMTPESVTITANRIDLQGLVNADELVSKFATILELNATNAVVENIKSTYITANKVKADYMEVANWTDAGYIRADKINAATLFASSTLSVGNINCDGDINLRGTTIGKVQWRNIVVNGITYTALCSA